MNLDRQRAIRAFVSRGSGLARSNVCPGNDSFPRPAGPYATVLVGTERQLGYSDSIERLNDDGDAREVVIEVWEALVYVQFFRDGAHDRAHRFGGWIDSPAGRLAEERMGLAEPVLLDAMGDPVLDEDGAEQIDPDREWGPREFGRMAVTGEIAYRQIDEIVADSWEERAGIDLTIQYHHSFVQPTGPIAEVPVTVSGEALTIGGS